MGAKNKSRNVQGSVAAAAPARAPAAIASSSSSRGGGAASAAAFSSSSEGPYVPRNGSWIAELEEALTELDDGIVGSAGIVAKSRRGDALKSYLRLCRCYTKLRQWENLADTAQKGIDVCASYPSSSSNDKVSDWKARFHSYREHSRRMLSASPARTIEDQGFEMVRHGILVDGDDPNMIPFNHPVFPNSNLFHCSVLAGDIRLMEAMVSLGAAIDLPFWGPMKGSTYEVVAPTDATALVIACAALANADRGDGGPLWYAGGHHAPSHSWSHLRVGMDRVEECAAQLVRLGANIHHRLNVSNAAPLSPAMSAYRAAGYDGKSAYELATCANRPDLVRVMDEHKNCATLEDRAQLVHCRCGSRLPWTECHSTGIGMPLPYCNHEQHGLMFRVSPLAKCPCRKSTKIHYECCWKDTFKPAMLIDDTGTHLRRQVVIEGSEEFDAVMTMRLLSQVLPPTDALAESNSTYEEMALRFAVALRVLPDLLPNTFVPKGGITPRVASWDPLVYAGCLERLPDQESAFLWNDLHWNLDKPELLRRAADWNVALQAYCDDRKLSGNERDRVMSTHTANPCAPCGRPGCGRFEREVREFQRCSKCRNVSYCGRDCQKKDWSHNHRQRCISQDELLSDRSQYPGSPGVARHYLTRPLR